MEEYLVTKFIVEIVIEGGMRKMEERKVEDAIHEREPGPAFRS